MKKLLILSVFPFSLCCVSSSAQWVQQVSGTIHQLEEIFFPAPDTGFVAGWSGTLLKTTNGGNTWFPLSAGTSLNLYDIYFVDTQTGFIAGDSGLFGKTTDGGMTWSVQYLTNINEIKLSSVFFLNADTGFAGGMETLTPGIIFKTTNGGFSWSVASVPPVGGDVNFQRISFPAPDTGYALTRGMCMKTTDGGNSWFITDTSLVAAGGIFSILEDCHFFTADTGYIVGWYNPFNGYTTDGYHWTDNFIGSNQWFVVEFPTRQTGYLAGWGEMYKTSDGGLTWYDIATPLVQNGSIFSMTFTDENTGYACGNNGFIIKTTTGGTSGINELNENLFSIYPNPSGGNISVEFNENPGMVFYEITNVIGGKIIRGSFNSEIENRLRLNLPSGSGMYMLRAVSEKGISVQKILVSE